MAVLLACCWPWSQARAQTYLINENWNGGANGWQFSTGGGANDWNMNATGGVGSTQCLWHKLCSTNNSAISQGVTLTAGVTYTIKFNARMNNSTGRQLWAAVNTTRARNGSQQQIFYHPTLTTTATNYTNTFTVSTTGTYYLMFYAEVVTATYINVYIDDVQLYYTNALPTVSVTAPANNSVITAGSNTTITANASDDGSITKVEFWANGSKLGEDNAAPYEQVYNVPAGSNSIYAKAFDNQSASANSSTITVTGNQAPVATLTAPADNAILAQGTVALTATATDADGSIAKMQFYVDGNLVNEDFASPFTYNWAATSGSYNVSAVAVDNNGASSASSTASVIINQPPTVSLTVPASSATGTVGNITLRANASDPDGGIYKVRFFVNGNEAGQDSIAPYALTRYFAAGSYTISAEAIDDRGFTATTSANSLTVSAGTSQTFFADNFNVNLNGWYLKNPNSSHNWQYWTDGNGQNGTNCLHAKQALATDYFASPQVTLSATQQYNLVMNARLTKSTTIRDIVVAYNSVRDRAGATVVDTLRLPNNGYATPPYTEFVVPFSPAANGSYYMVFWALGSGYVDMYVDSTRLETNGIPTASLTAPANNAVINEGSGPISITATAADGDGSITKVEFYANGLKLGEDLSSPFAFSWSNYLPGIYTISAIATDNRGNRSPADQRQIDIRFSDGTISDYVHYSFESGISPWTAVSPATAATRNGLGYQGSNTFWYYTNQAGGYLHSPRLYLFAGQTYKLEYRADGTSTNGRSILAGYNTSPSLTGVTQIGTTFSVVSSTDYAKNSYTFTVPADGAYNLIFWTTNTGYVQFYLDDIRLIGDMNEAPLVSLTQPAANTVVAEGATITFVATANDPDGNVVNVAFQANGSTVGNDAASPYSATYSGLGNGATSLQAIATDNRGGEGFSTTVPITVDPNRVNVASYLGGSASNDAIVGAAILPDSTLVLAANIGDATPGGLTPILLNGASASSSGAIVRLAANGQTVLSVTRLAALLTDMSHDTLGNLFIGAGPDGLLKVNSTATSLIWKKTFDKNVFRVDAGKAGNSVVLTAPGTGYEEGTITGVTIRVHDASGTELGAFGGPTQYSMDVAIDEASQTIISVGKKNFYTPSFTGAPALPVYVPVVQGRTYSGTIKYTAYDWESDQNSSRWLNKSENNMADAHAERVEIGEDGKAYVLFEVAGGNHVLRYDPFDIMKKVTIVGGDNYFGFSNTGTELKTVIGRFEPGTGAWLLGQQMTARLSSGAGNSFRCNKGNIAADKIGRVYVTGSSSAGMPINLEYLPGAYTGGSYLLVLSPDFTTRELSARFNTGGWGRAVAVRGDQVLVVGQTTASNQFIRNGLQTSLNGGGDGWFVVGNYNQFFKYRPGVHPRLFFSQSDVAALRAKATVAPFNSMLTTIQSTLSLSNFANEPIDTLDPYDLITKAKNLAFLYVIDGDEAKAIECRQLVQKVINQTTYPWASTSVKGLASYLLGSSVAIVFDWCHNSPHWDAQWRYTVSQKLVQMADMITANGGTEQATDLASNWQGARGASAGLIYLAADHTLNTTNLDAMHNKVFNYVNSNLGSGSASKGWNLEGLGYTFYPWGMMVGPYGIAMARYDANRDLRNINAVRWLYWTGYSVISNALNLNGFGGFRPDFSDDNPHMAGEGFYGQAFWYGMPEHIKGMKYWYDRTQGSSSPYGAQWDKARCGTIWSYLYYPKDSVATQPMTIAKWREGFKDDAGNGFYTYRNTYSGANDHVAQFRAKLRNTSGSHDAPDALGFRIIGNGYPWAVGGGRDDPGRTRNQNTLYKADPGTGTVSGNRNLGTLVGTPVTFNDGSGHAIASMTTSSTAVAAHKRWFVANYNTGQTGADATYVIGDESTDGKYFQLNTYAPHSISTSGNTFTITAADGSTLLGTVVYPSSNFRFVTGTRARGSNYGTEANNGFIHLQSDNGDFLIVLTLKKTGSHPAISYSGTGVTNAAVTVGSMTFTLLSNDVTYSSPMRMAQAGHKPASQLLVYPNPATQGRLYVQLPGEHNAPLAVQLINSAGQLVRRLDLNQASGTVEINTENLPGGLYLLQLQGGEINQQVRVNLGQ